jgi:type III pantothenate kinase
MAARTVGDDVMKTAVLVVDIGNTSTSFGLYRAGRVFRVGRLPTHESPHARIRRALRLSIRNALPGHAMVSSVAPSANGAWGDILEETVGRPARWVHHRMALGIPLTYPRPASIGADRLANACGGAAKYGCPLIVADFGTAVTFDVVTRGEGYVGGVIAPGLPLMFSYLAEKTEALPRIAPQPVRGRIGRSTEEAMNLGALWGYRGMVREILRELRRAESLRRAALCATGGFAGWVVKGMRPRIRVDPHLTLFGIGRLHELNPSE